MKNQYISHPLAIHPLVNRLSTSSTPSATRKHSLIVNDVPKELYVNADENMIAAIFGSLLNTVISNTENSCIRVSARIYGKVVLVHLRESHRSPGTAFKASIRQAQQLAGKIGGTVSISNDHNKATSIIFSFVNNSSLAA